ncbi:MAG: hypothetical protein HXY20_14860 [Acidobacteria bacterium]|nr:hypothetical protein [Acidobacteriota bacterium]
MNNSKPTSLIESAFAAPKGTLCRGRILLPSSPPDLEEVIQAAVETEQDQETFEGDGPEAVAAEIGREFTRLVAFYWQSLGPMVWECCIDLLNVGNGKNIVCLKQDGWPRRQAIAALKGRPERPLVTALFRNLLKENGAAFGVGLFGSLPSNTDNFNEKLIPEETIRRCYWDWMNWAERELDADWIALAEEVTARALSPVLYPLDILKGLPPAEDLSEWLEKQRSRNGGLSMRAKRAVFDAYFKQSYGPY